MIRACIALCLVAAACAAPHVAGFDSSLDTYWESYKSAYNKQYLDHEHYWRRSVWEKNLGLLREHNLQADLGQHTYRLGVNQYADWTSEEFVKYMNGYRQNNSSGVGSTFMAPSYIEVPDHVDWRTEGYVTPVKNQGQCGSCWAFSTTGSLEGQHFKATGKLVSLSEQNLVDCSQKYGNNGCQGGLMDNAFKYIMDNNGIDTEESYPYTAKDGTCHFQASDVGATDTGFTDIPQGDETSLMQAAATVGPISVAIDASSFKFQLYKSGVFNDKSCSSTQLDHGVLVVGYGSQDGDDYWLVKNSWGASWGMQGYIMMSRNKNNQCGIATSASYPLV